MPCRRSRTDGLRFYPAGGRARGGAGGQKGAPPPRARPARVRHLVPSLSPRTCYMAYPSIRRAGGAESLPVSPRNARRVSTLRSRTILNYVFCKLCEHYLLWTTLDSLQRPRACSSTWPSVPVGHVVQAISAISTGRQARCVILSHCYHLVTLASLERDLGNPLPNLAVSACLTPRHCVPSLSLTV